MTTITHYALAFVAGIIGGYFAATALAGILHYGFGAPDGIALAIAAMSYPVWTTIISYRVAVRLLCHA